MLRTWQGFENENIFFLLNIKVRRQIKTEKYKFFLIFFNQEIKNMLFPQLTTLAAAGQRMLNFLYVCMFVMQIIYINC